jgi:hypothetical protein
VTSASANPEPIPVTVAYLETRDGPEAARRAATAFQAAALAFSNAAFAGDLPVSIELVGFDAGPDPTAALAVAGGVAADPSVVAAIGAPGLGSRRSR